MKNKNLFLSLDRFQTYESYGVQEIVLTSRHGREIKFIVKNGRFSQIDNQAGIKFPFSVGQIFTRSVETWAENNHFLWNGKDIEKDNRKIFGVRTKDVPMGHEWRLLFPGKFR